MRTQCARYKYSTYTTHTHARTHVDTRADVHAHTHTHTHKHTPTCLTGPECALENELDRDGGKETVYGSCCWLPCCCEGVGKEVLAGRDILPGRFVVSACSPPCEQQSDSGVCKGTPESTGHCNDARWSSMAVRSVGRRHVHYGSGRLPCPVRGAGAPSVEAGPRSELGHKQPTGQSTRAPPPCSSTKLSTRASPLLRACSSHSQHTGAAGGGCLSACQS